MNKETRRPGYDKFIATEFKPIVKDSIRKSKPKPKPIVKTIKTIKTKDADEKKLESQMKKIWDIVDAIVNDIHNHPLGEWSIHSDSPFLPSFAYGFERFTKYLGWEKPLTRKIDSMVNIFWIFKREKPNPITNNLNSSGEAIKRILEKSPMDEKGMTTISTNLTKIEKLLQDLKSNWQKIFAKEIAIDAEKVKAKAKPKSKEANDKVKSSLVKLLKSKQSSLKLKGEPKRAYEKALSKLEDREDDFIDSVEEYVDEFINGSTKDDAYSPETLYASYATPNSDKHDVYEDLSRLTNKYGKTYTNSSIKQWQQAFLKVVLEWSGAIGGDDDWS